MLFRRFQGMAGAAPLAVLLLAAAQAAGAAETGSVTVLRGAEASTVSFSNAGPVHVQRGAAVKTLAYSPPAAKAPKVLAGERLWIVDSRSERVTVCASRRSIQVGQRNIRCTSRALPARLLSGTD